MLSVYQRLLLGYLLLVALVAGICIHGRFTPRALAVCVVLAALIAAASYLAATRPIRRVAEAARRFARGDFEQRTRVRMRGDLGVIAAELDREGAQLDQLHDTEFGRIQLEQQLSDAVVRSLFEPVIVTDANGQVLKLNQPAQEILGDAAGDRMALAATPGGEKILGAVREAVSMQRPIANEGEAALLPMKIGQAQRTYRLRTTPMRDPDGRLLGAVSVLEDITEMQDLDLFKTKFLTIASEKLRAPLEHLRLGLYTLTRGFAGDLRPLQVDLLHDAEREAEHLDDLMSDIIEVSELDSGHKEIRLDRIRPIDILRDAYSRFRAAAGRKKIEIEIQAFSDLPYINGDRRAVRRIMDNLLSNAVNYTDGGTILLQAEEHRDKVQFFVRDSGKGIATDRLPGLFGRFNTSVEGGTGLGLALVRRLVELLGGQVSVESRIGHGTTFSFTLPLAAPSPTRHPIEVG